MTNQKPSIFGSVFIILGFFLSPVVWGGPLNQLDRFDVVQSVSFGFHGLTIRGLRHRRCSSLSGECSSSEVLTFLSARKSSPSVLQACFVMATQMMNQAQRKGVPGDPSMYSRDHVLVVSWSDDCTRRGNKTTACKDIRVPSNCQLSTLPRMSSEPLPPSRPPGEPVFPYSEPLDYQGPQ